METTNQNEQGAGRIAAALSATLKGIFEVQESQKRIEDQHKKSGEERSLYSDRLLKIESGLGQGFECRRGQDRVCPEDRRGNRAVLREVLEREEAGPLEAPLQGGRDCPRLRLDSGCLWAGVGL